MSFKWVSSCSDTTEIISENRPPLLLNVPGWSREDVCGWITRIEFSKYATRFLVGCVDGDQLLRMTEDRLRDKIGINSEIERKRFMRELDKLKQLADYSSIDPTDLKSVLQSIGPEFTVYTYPMLNVGVDSDSIRFISADQLADKCGITNSIHRARILNSMVRIVIEPPPDDVDSRTLTPSLSVLKVFDVFISYERCTRSAKLASLLKAYLEFKRYSVCLESDRQTSGEYDENMLDNIKMARNFLLVLTDESLNGCIGDDECKNWMHKEIVWAVRHGCNIIPVTENFTWPSEETLPADMRDLPGFNGVRWVHDYKNACVEKIEKFMRGTANRAVTMLRSAPNTPLMARSTSTLGYHRSGSSDTDRDANAGRLRVDRSYASLQPSDRSVERLSVSLGDLFQTTIDLDLIEHGIELGNDAVENICIAPEDIVEHQGIEMPVNIPFGTPKISFLKKLRLKFRPNNK